MTVAETTKRVRCPRVKDGIYTVYVSEKHRKIENKLNALNTLINDGHITGVSSGSDLINIWVTEKFNEMIEKVLAKKVKAPVEEEALTVAEPSDKEVQLHIENPDLNRLLVDKYVVPTEIPRLDDYCHGKIGGKSTSEAFKTGEISKETAVDIFMNITEIYYDMACIPELIDARSMIKSKNDTRKKKKMGRFREKLEQSLVIPYKPNSPPVLEYNPDEYEDIPEPIEIPINDPYYDPFSQNKFINN